MSKVIVVTDSNSGITPDEAKKLGVEVIPMPFYIDEQMYYENIDLTQEQFYEKLTAVLALQRCRISCRHSAAISKRLAARKL